MVFSAHGVPKTVPAAAKAREMVYLDATCPLVSKVHVEAQKHFDAGREIVLIGHAGHPEVIGTMGQLPEGTVTLIEDIDDARAWVPENPANVAFLTQTTLSVDDTAEMVDLLKARFPGIAAPHKEDICYATTNRQEAVKSLAEASDLILVVGSKNSSNSVRLMEVGKRAGARDARLIDDARGIDWSWFEGWSPCRSHRRRLGARGPGPGRDRRHGRPRYDVTVEELIEARETVTFKLPRAC